jgi:uncharacterized SAM-binding protein YcdF (DUF218 family)
VLRRAFALLAALVAIWIAVSLVFFTWSPWASAGPTSADVVVVLSGAHDRLPRALALVDRGVAPVLAISSISHSPRWRAAKRLCAARRYRSAAVVCFEARPYSTRGEAETVARLAARRHWRRVVVVTSNFHITRARMLFRRCYHGSLWMVPASTPWWQLPADWADETAKLTYQLTAQRSC